RLGAVFVAGVVFVVLTLVRLRSWLANALSPSLKYSFVVGIGLFLAFIGLYQTGIVTSFVEGMPVPPGSLLDKPGVPGKIGELRDPKVLLAIGGFVLTAVLICWRVRGAILIAIVATAVAGFALGFGKAPAGVAALPFVGEYDVSPIALKLDVPGVLKLSFLPV